ncbi:MAG: phosphoglycerate mutase [Candidatus Micrarchaeota archaeon]
MKTLLVVLDGVGDWPCKELGGKTPLEAAYKPHLNKLATNSILLRSRIAGNVAPESDVGVLSLLGINPFKKKIGRGIFEWLSTGKQFKNGWLAIRTNFCTLKNGEIVDRRAGRKVTPTLAKRLAKKINSIKLSVPFEFVSTADHRGAVLFRGNYSRDVQNTDPAYQRGKQGISDAQAVFGNGILPCTPLKSNAKSKRTARVINEFSEKVINALKDFWPANGLLLRNAENVIPLENYSKWLIVAEMPLEVGIGKTFKMKVVKSREGDYVNAARIANREISKRDVYIHLKGPDLYGHDGDANGKKKCIERIDKEFFAALKVPANVRVIITADHCTCCKLKAHSSDPVPALIAGAGVKGEKNYFCERSAAKKREIPAWNLLKLAAKPTLRV